ncbi:MAG: acetyl-CoA carboxylase biotin carboxyl carrier protein [Candidatus Bipolaricaulota bacterium]
MDIDIDQMRELVNILEQSDLAEISIQEKDAKITLKKDRLEVGLQNRRESGSVELQPQREAGAEGERASPLVSSAEEGDVPVVERSESEPMMDGTKPITSPIVGTFYRSSSPEESAYVEVGDDVQPGDTVCIIEAMKVMNEVKAETQGKIVEICVEDGAPVEYGQDLFMVDPFES